MMRYKKLLGAWVVAAMMVACGGGGGSPAVPLVGVTGTTGSTGATTTTTTPAATASATLDVFGGSGVSTTTISAVEISQVKAVVKDAAGAVVKGTVVTFSESGPTLLTFSPAAKTALTDDTGTAIIEIRAASAANVGATTVVATATVAGTAVTAQKSISITTAPSTGMQDPQSLASALNFLDVNPADRSIVLAGSGGNGRSESATLRFRVVDRNNTPVKGVAVTFSVTPPNDVTLNVPTATSDSDGVVVTTVSSKTVATAVVVTATVNGKSISSQSDQLLVTTGVATQAGFDISAEKYNLNLRKTGDSTKVIVRIVDANGNPVADGVPVVFTTNYGAIGTSSRGGCVTSGGACDVTLSVQDPRPVDGTFVTVTASTRVGSGATISRSVPFVMSDVGLVNVYDARSGGIPLTTLPPTGCAAQTFSMFAGTPAGFAAPANTTVTTTAITSGLTATVKSGSPILDALSFQRTNLDIEVNVSGITGPTACVAAGGNTTTATFDITFTADGIVQTRRVQFTYPIA